MRILIAIFVFVGPFAAIAADNGPKATAPSAPIGKAQIPAAKAEDVPMTTPPAPVAVSPTLEPERQRYFKVSTGIFYSTANELKFTNGTISGNSGGSSSFNATYQTDPAFGISLEAIHAERDSWGYSFGASYEFKRNVNSVIISSNTLSSNVNYGSDLAPMIQEVEALSLRASVA